METVALYRKYRPKSFAEVVGQDHIVNALETSVKNGTASHAYLFVGTRGTGKTTVARIFADALGVSANDLYEIDAASNRGIDDIRELRDGVRVLPFDSKYKMYIIDEVHMLSKDAWGALLKTLEEPPQHVIFILATTELHKVPETIISRCQVFTFKKATDIALKKVFATVSQKEGFELGAGVAEILSILADGSFRDGLGVLQKVLNLSKSKKVSIEEVEEITGTPKSVLVNDFIASIAESDLEKGMRAVERARDMNLDMKLFLKLIVLRCRMAIIIRYAPKLIEDMTGDMTEADITFLRELVKADTKGMLRSKALSILLEAYQNIDNAFVAGLPLELALVAIIGGEK
jgi:DNA polymerase-3 subunit gamma/tau